ncbi:hypothetical protein [Runella aurantiaca]|uniref:Uncharacterized protein n=1 Tax=Runella aurantiaca TaxID=2282308 RepID=A0A369I4J9_9BACT|nr:hypothetical protein [Runella aurantiaca]RDB03427.1 hypothetical protein DVG78_24085 [Runella aurantiaca]
MKKELLSFILLVPLLQGGSFVFAQSITLDPRTTAPTQAKVLVEGVGPAQSLWGPYYPIASERMGLKAVAPPTSGTKTTAITGIVDQYSNGGQTGEATGVMGFSASKTKAHGLLGIADGQGAGSIVYGVRGYASNISSNTSTFGGMFTSWREGSENSNGYGIYAGTNHYRAAATGNSYGGYFYAIGQGISNKVGVLSEVDHLTSAPVAAVGATGFQANISGPYSSQVIGLYTNIATTGNNGTFGAKLDYTGVAGNSASIYGLQANVKGTGAASYRYGGYFDVDGSTWNNSYGIYARSNIVSHAQAANGLNSYGGYFVATGSSLNQFGIYATSDANLGPNIRYAGYFAGNVSVTGNLTKGSGTFKIDHPQDPENKFLYHSFVESPDMKNIYDGVITTDANGDATVEMPAYFEALNQDFRYQLTGIGQFAQAIVADEINHNRFKIKTDKPNVKVSWQVTGIRKDAYAEANRVVVEVEKQGEEKGKYLHPEVFGKDKVQGISSLHELKAENK